MKKKMHDYLRDMTNAAKEIPLK